MSSQTPQPGLRELMGYLTERGLRKAICTRNFPAPVEHLLAKFVPGEAFGPVITRDSQGIEPKPSPEGLWFIARSWGLGQEELEEVKSGEADVLEQARRYLGEGLIMVGDSIDDLAAGYRAGAATVLLVNDENSHLEGHEYCDLSVKRLDDLVEVLEGGFVGRS